jgi:hypothetical protein
MKKKILLIHYYGGAAGKFVSNCLSYSKQVAFQNYDKALAILKTNDLCLMDQYALATVPEKINSRQWDSYEEGCAQLFGLGINHVESGIPFYETLLHDMSEFDNIWLPKMSHTLEQFNRLTSFFSNNEVFTVFLDGTPEFIDLAIRKKWPMEHHCIDLDSFKIFQENSTSMNFDFYIRNWDPLIVKNHDMITTLADKIGINFDIRLCQKYIEKYINFYL